MSMKKSPTNNGTTAAADPVPRLRRRTLRTLTEAELGKVNAGRRNTNDTGTTGWFNDCNTFDTVVGC